MAKSVLELAVGTGQWDAGLKKAKSALDSFTEANGGLQQALGKESQKMQQFVRMMGGMESTAKTAKGQMNDYKSTIEQLTMQYNRMSDAQKKVVGQDYLQSIDQLKQKYQAVNEEIQEMNRSLNNVKAPDVADGVKAGGLFGGGKLDGMLQVFGGNLMTKGAELATSAVTSLISETGDMIRQGVELAKAGEGIRIAFERLGRGDILQGLREATHGTVTDLELMKAAVKFNDFKLPLDELGTMLAFAQQKAKDTGQSVDYMVDSIVTGLGRKSLMILDNLGLSATEVRERMKETGDMTKAVGAIIREQMAKAGDYVETAADRAAQANVSLQNKMEELGRKFAPVEEASNQLWTSMKIGILDVVGGPLARLLNGLTEAGRMMNAYGKMGGSGKVGRMTANLAGASEGNRQSIYQQQQAQFWKYINPREQQIKDIRAWQSGERNDALQKRIGAITEKYGSLDATKIQAEVDAAKKMLSDYQTAAKQILQPIEQKIVPTFGDGGSGGKGGRTTTHKATTEYIPLEGSIDAQTKKVQDLQKAWRAAADDKSREDIKKQIEQAQLVLDAMNGKTKTSKITITADTKEALEAVKKIDGVKIEPKSFTVTVDDDKAADELRKMGAVQIADKTFTVTAEDDKAAEELKKLGAVQISDKTFSITANGEDVLKNINAIDGVKIEPKSFTVTVDDDKAADELRKMGAVQIADKTFSVIPDIGDTLEKVKAIDGVKIDTKSFTVTAEDDKAADELRKMGAVQIDDKTFSVIPDIGDTLEKVKAIDGAKIDPKTFIITAETTEALAKIQEINGIKIQPKKLEVQVPKMADIAPNGLTGKARTPEDLQQGAVKMKQAVKLEIDQEASKVDTETLHTLIKDAIQNGINGMDIRFGALGEQIGKGIDIPDDSWQGILDQYNALREQIGLEPIVIDFETGKIDKVVREVEKLKKTINTTANVVGTIGQAFNAIEDPAAKVAGVVAQAIANVALAYSDALAKTQAEKFNIWGFIAASAAAMVSMGTTIASIHSATGYAEGGVVKGNHYSGDMLDGGSFGINAGELVLNRAQQGSLASQLEGGGLRNLRLSAEVQGEKIVLVANRYFRRTGQGEIVTWK